MNGIDQYQKQVSFYQNRILVLLIGVGVFLVVITIFIFKQFGKRHETPISSETVELNHAQFEDILEQLQSRQQGTSISPFTQDATIGKPEPFGPPF